MATIDTVTKSAVMNVIFQQKQKLQENVETTSPDLKAVPESVFKERDAVVLKEGEKWYSEVFKTLPLD